MTTSGINKKLIQIWLTAGLVAIMIFIQLDYSSGITESEGRTAESIQEGVPSIQFNDLFDVKPGTAQLSEKITVSGLEAPVEISIQGGYYSINGGKFTESNGILKDQDLLQIRILAPDEPGSIAFADITIGDQRTTFAVRTVDTGDSGWDLVPGILEKIVPPVFPDHRFPITEFGAVADGSTNCTEAFKQAIEACHDAGGGMVVVPAGEYLTGPIHLKSNVNLNISKDAVVRFSTDPADYLPVVFTRWEGTECMNYSPLIYAFEQENIAITGEGTLDGQASFDNWWAMIRSARQDIQNLRQMGEDGIPVEERIFGEGHYLRPLMIQPYRCKNILIENVSIMNSPFWHIHPVLSSNITVKNVTITGHGPNNDGFDPESCSDILVENCSFDTGDDCIAIKSGRNADGRRIIIPTKNMIVRRCTMKDGHGGVVIGSEITGGANAIYAEDCVMDSPNLDRALRIKTNSIRGGVVENIYVRNITVGQVADAAIRVNYLYGEGDVADYVPTVRNVEVRNMTCKKSNYVFRFDGYDRAPITDIRVIDCEFENISRENHLVGYNNLVLKNVKINGSVYNKILVPANE